MGLVMILLSWESEFILQMLETHPEGVCASCDQLVVLCADERHVMAKDVGIPECPADPAAW